MTAIILPSRWTKQPQGAVGIDYGNPITRGIGAAGFGDTEIELVSGVPASQIASPNKFVKGVGLAGRCKIGTEPTYNSLWTDIYSHVSFGKVSTPQSVFALVKLNSLGTIQGLVGTAESGSVGIGLKVNSSNQIRVGVNNTYVIGQTLEANKLYFLVGTADGTNAKIYVNGTLSASGSMGLPAAASGGFAVNGSYSSESLADIYAWGGFGRALSDAEVRAFSENPWQIFKPKKQVIYSFSSGITVQTLFVVTYPAGGGTPSNVQIVAGQQYSGAAASWAGNAEWTGSGQYLEATGLSASTEYDSAAVIFDGTTYSNVVEVSGIWTTLSGAALRFARPSSDLSAGAWTPSTGAVLYAMLDEETASDTDYIETTTASTCEVALNAVTDPATSSGQVVTIRAQSANGNDLVATLKQGATTIATRTFTSLGASWADYTITLSGAECDAITDYANLSVTLEAQ